MPEKTAEEERVEAMAQLLPCPFCGGQARLLNGCPGSWFVQCVGCHATGDDRHRDAAVAVWNRRHDATLATRPAQPSPAEVGGEED